MVEIKTDCVQPWHVYTLLFGVFWLLSAYFDNFFISFLLCVIGGFVSEILNKSLPIKFHPLSSDSRVEESSRLLASKPAEEPFYDKPLPPVPVEDDVVAQENHLESSMDQANNDQENLEDDDSPPPSPPAHAHAVDEAMDEKLEQEEVNQAPNFFGSDPVPVEIPVITAEDTDGSSSSKDERREPSMETQSLGRQMDPEPEDMPNPMDQYHEHNVLDDEQFLPYTQEEELIMVKEIDIAVQRDLSERAKREAAQKASKNKQVDFDDDCDEDLQDLIRNKRETEEEDFDADCYEEEQDATRHKREALEEGFDASPDVVSVPVVTESNAVLDDLANVPNTRSEDIIEPSVMEELKEEYQENVRSAQSLVPERVVDPKLDSSGDEEERIVSEPDTAKASDEPFTFSKIGDKLEEMKGDIMGHFTHKNESDHEEEKEKFEEPIRASEAKESFTAPADEKTKDDGMATHDNKPIHDSFASTGKDLKSTSEPLQLSAPIQNQSEMVDLLEDAQKESLSPKSVSPSDQDELVQLDHLKGDMREDEDEISDPLEAERKGYEQAARDNLAARGTYEALSRPLDTISITTSDANGDDISHRAVFGDDQEQDVDQLDDVLTRDEPEGGDKSSPDGSANKSGGLFGMGEKLAEFAKEHIIEPVKDAIHPDTPPRETKSPAVDIDLNDPLVEVAATKIQAAFKGYRARSQMKLGTS